MVKHSKLLLDELYNAFDPFQPLPAGDQKYVDCRRVRGDEDILVDFGNRIRRSQRMTCLLYSGHRGAGKSTELLRLKQFLEQEKCYVVYFAADEEDIDSEDAQYTDILLACTRHLLEALKESAKPRPILDWLKSRWQELKDLAQTPLEFEGMSVEQQISQFAKITANLRAEPTLRQRIRKEVNPHTVTLTEVLNQFLGEAKKQLPNSCTQLAVIVDNLDRIAPIIQEGDKSNHEEIFVDRCEQLKALDCHLIYTVPISLVYSTRATDLRDIYSDTQVLPMVMVQTPDGVVCTAGLAKIKEVISRRVSPFAPNSLLDTEIFNSRETLERLCLMSGGHVRNLLLLTQDAIGRTASLPISERAVRVAVTRARDIYRRTVENNQWQLLAEVSRSRRIVNDDEYRSLLFNRCLLEYRYWNKEGELDRWCDVHPLIKGIPEYKEAVAQFQP